MGNLVKSLKSGAELEATLCSFDVAEELLQAVTQEMAGINMSFSGIDMNDIMNSELSGSSINTIKNMVSAVIVSPKIQACVWKCLARATRDNVKITREMFEDVSARSDYLEIMKEVLVFNLSPFFGNLASLLHSLVAQQKSPGQE